MKLKEITFHLENCDHITIDGKYIGDFLVDKIETSIRRCACNTIMKSDVAKVFAIEVHKDANKNYNPFGEEDWETTVFKRLVQHRDICQIDFTLIENYPEEGKEPYIEHYEYFVDWCGESDYENDAQVSYISDLGHLYIVIKKDSKINEFFNKEDINEKIGMDHKFFMYDVGDDNQWTQ